jgi:hypothetical protein
MNMKQKQQQKKPGPITPDAPPNTQGPTSPAPQDSAAQQSGPKTLDANARAKQWWEALRSKEEALKQFIPMPREHLADLWDYLYRDDHPDCDHTLRDTLAFLHERKLDVDPIVEWLNEHGGYCDCEVRLNVMIWVAKYLALVEEADTDTAQITNAARIHAHCNSIAKEHRELGPCNHAAQDERLRSMPTEARRAKTLKNGYKLQNGEEMHRLHPDTFELHSKEDRNDVKVGQHVKVCLVGPTGDEPSERFWVWIVSKDATAHCFTFIGLVHADLWYTASHGIREGDMLQFGTEHILVIEQ